MNRKMSALGIMSCVCLLMPSSLMAQAGNDVIESTNVQRQVINSSNTRSVSNFSETITSPGTTTTNNSSNQIINNSAVSNLNGGGKYILTVTTNGIKALQGNVIINGKAIPLTLRRTTVDVTNCIRSGNCNIAVTGNYQPARGMIYTRVTSSDGSLNNTSQSGGSGKVNQQINLGIK